MAVYLGILDRGCNATIDSGKRCGAPVVITATHDDPTKEIRVNGFDQVTVGWCERHRAIGEMRKSEWESRRERQKGAVVFMTYVRCTLIGVWMFCAWILVYAVEPTTPLEKRMASAIVPLVFGIVVYALASFMAHWIDPQPAHYTPEEVSLYTWRK